MTAWTGALEELMRTTVMVALVLCRKAQAVSAVEPLTAALTQIELGRMKRKKCLAAMYLGEFWRVAESVRV